VKVRVPTTVLTARVEKTNIAQAAAHGITTLKIPKRCTNKFGTTRPTTLAPFKIAIYKEGTKFRQVDLLMRTKTNGIKCQTGINAIHDGVKLQKKYRKV